jgi:TetR/AcrR family transcriptional regulator, transcriptional repressor for nem operon
MPNRPGAPTPAPTTRDHVLDVAERLAQTRGFNGFSYADIAAELGITKASLHYHYPTKADLGCALVDRYGQRFRAALGRISATGRAASQQLAAYIELYADVLRDDRLCLCGMLAAESSTLPEPMRRAIRGFFESNEAWLAPLLETGRRAGDLTFTGAADEAANALTCTLEGAMLLARSYGDASRFATAAARLLRDLAPAPADGRPAGRTTGRPRGSGGRPA